MEKPDTYHQKGIHDAQLFAEQLREKEIQFLENYIEKLREFDDTSNETNLQNTKRLRELEQYVRSIHSSRSWRLMQFLLRLLGRTR